MKITKFEHSCVLIEDQDNVILTDPGVFAWNSGEFDMNTIPKLQIVIVTHKHGDHYSTDFAKALIEKFTDLIWIAPSDLHDELINIGAKNVTNQSNSLFEVIEGNHALVEPFGIQVNNLIVNYQDKITISGDTLDYSISKDLLLLAIQAPWASTVDALKLAIKLKPKYVLPVHDWMWVSEWKKDVYSRFETVLAENGIKFFKPINGESIEIDL